MKIITMERKTLDGEPVDADALNENPEDYRDWWGVIETKAEELVYDRLYGGYYDKNAKARMLIDDLWCAMVNTGGVNWGDDDVYGYIRPDEVEPEVGEEYEDADGDIWRRVE